MGTWLRMVAWVVAILGAIFAVLHLFFFEVWRVPSDDPLSSASIEPTLSAGDLIVVARHSTVGRGDLLRCPDPDAAGRFVIARAIGAFGDHVEIKDETVKLDGKRNPSPRSCPEVTLYDPRNDEDTVLSCSVEDFGDMPFSALRARAQLEPPMQATVEPSRWFLVSDDRHIHLDSRDYGQVDVSNCRHVVFRLASAAGFGDTRKRFSIIW